MVSLIRKYQQPLLIVFTIVICFIFILYWNGPGSMGNSAGKGSDKAGKLFGNAVTRTQLSREGRKADPIGMLGMNDLLNSLQGRYAQSHDEAVYNFAWSCLILKHQSEALQLEVTDEEVKTELLGMDVFQTAGAFDPEKFDLFVKTILPRFGFSGVDLEDMVKDNLRMKKVKGLLKATFVVSPDDYRATYSREYQKLETWVVHLNVEDIAAKIEVTDDDVKKAFEQYMELYKSEEKRGLKYVTFELSADDKKLTGKERTAALNKLSDEAAKFSQDMVEKGAKFDEVATKYKVTVAEVQPFAPSLPDPKVKDMPEVMAAIFSATKEDPNTDVVKGKNGSYVAQLQEIVPSKQLTLAEARPKIIEQIKNTRAKEKMETEARGARNLIAAALKEGKSIEEAVKNAGQKAEKYPPFSLAEPELEKTDSRLVLGLAIDMKEGELSELAPTMTGGMLVFLEKREPIDPAKFDSDRKIYEPRFAEMKLNQVFIEWMDKQREEAGVPPFPRAAPAPQ